MRPGRDREEEEETESWRSDFFPTDSTVRSIDRSPFCLCSIDRPWIFMRLMQNIRPPTKWGREVVRWRRRRDGCRLISPIAAVSCPSIDSPYPPPPPRATATFLRGLLINGESINGGLHGIPKKSQRGGGEGMDPPGSWRRFFFVLNEKWNQQLNELGIFLLYFWFRCSLEKGLFYFARKKLKIRLLICFEVTNVNILREYLFGYEKIDLSNGKLTNRADSSRRSGEGG